MKRLLGSIVDGIGLAAGRDLYEKAKKRALEELSDEPPDPEAEKARLEEERRAEKARAAAEEERHRAEAKRAKKMEKQVDKELAALKRKLKK
ncbi:MAG: hypothetical protein HYY06_19085 [Deltaproteobacteria bacterium]|nr:hypothetical protein [Deltaproteobacteria bacterium]